VSTEGGFRAVIAAGLANLGTAITEVVAFLFTVSSSMLSEAIHPMADTVNEALLLRGGRRAKRVPYGATRSASSLAGKVTRRLRQGSVKPFSP
jgi:divalent metal cation (Fe/Co/Zn/Cd) transporter